MCDFAGVNKKERREYEKSGFKVTTWILRLKHRPIYRWCGK